MINVILDLDNTLISSLDVDEERRLKRKIKNYDEWLKLYRWKNMNDEFKIFERPNLQPFLDWLFANFAVSVWTAASKTYALFVIEEFILKGHPDRHLRYVLYSHHCRESQKNKNVQKSLKQFSDNFGVNYSAENTVILDDHPEVFRCQPNQCVKIKPFDVNERNAYADDELMGRIKPIFVGIKRRREAALRA